jgi:hypothetical protein
MKIDLSNPLMLPVIFGSVAMITSMILLLTTQPVNVVYTDHLQKKRINYTQVLLISAFMAVLIGSASGLILNNVPDINLSSNY